MTAQQIIEALDMQPLPHEGGYYVVSFTADEQFTSAQLPPRYGDTRDLSGAILYLETPEQFSALHRLPTDELYYYHYGDPLEMLFLHEDGSGERRILGMDLTQGQQPQVLAPRYSWQGSRPWPQGRFGFTLLSTSMAPGYHPKDPEYADREELCAQYPKYQDLILALTRSGTHNV